MAWASSARTCAVEYRAVGSAMRLIILSAAAPPMTDPNLNRPPRRCKAQLLAARAAHSVSMRGRRRASSCRKTSGTSSTWLDAGYHGEMDYMHRHGSMRSRPAELAPGTVRVISVRMNYWPARGARWPKPCWVTLRTAYVSRYALGRDYHKVMRRALARLAEELAARDRAFRLSRLRGQRAGAGEGAGAQRRARLDRQAHQPALAGCGLVFLPGRDPHGPATAMDAPASAHCGTCEACIPACPTQAIVAPLSAGCAALHLVSDDREQGRDSGRAAHADRQPHLRVR